ncbi:MAG: hypothetical protein JNJ92_11030 [Altererythrobacter sp.]|nr:hypothetical protein [Altererythrobacter sp.]
MAKSAATDAQKRKALRARIDARTGEARQRRHERGLADQARNAADGAIAYVRANPLVSIAAVAVGALVIGALTRPGRRAGRKAGALAGVATDAALAYGLSLLDSASTAASKGQDRIADLGDRVGGRARDLQATAIREGGNLSEYLVTAARRRGQRAGRTIEDLRSRITH